MYRERNSKDGCIQSYTTQSINQSYLTESSKMLDALKSRYITCGWALWRKASPLAAPRAAIRTCVFHEIGWKNVPPVFFFMIEKSDKKIKSLLCKTYSLSLFEDVFTYFWVSDSQDYHEAWHQIQEASALPLSSIQLVSQGQDDPAYLNNWSQPAQKERFKNLKWTLVS